MGTITVHVFEERLEGSAFINAIWHHLRFAYQALASEYGVSCDDKFRFFHNDPLHHLFVVVRGNKVVPIHEGDVFRGGIFQPGFSRGDQSGVLFVDDLNAGILFGVTVANLRFASLRSIVYQKNFEILVGLRKNAVNTFLEIILNTIYGYDNRQIRKSIL